MTDINPNESTQNYTQPSYSPMETPPPRPPKKGLGAKGVIALIISCAILFTGIGFGSAWFLVHEHSDSSQTQAEIKSPHAKPETTSPDLSLKMAKGEEGALTIPEIAAKASDSVVEITTESVVTGNMLQQYISSGAGSGVIVTEDGYIITNNHVIEGATSITVTLHNGETYPASVVGLDDQLDVALLKIDATDLSPATIGTSSDLIVGQTVVAIGNPLGQLGGTVTDGILSALDRNITLDGETMTLLQTNAAINPGNSGGGLFDAQGNLIGLVVAKSAGENIEGLGFAIPVDHVVAVLNDLKEYGYVKGRVSLGLSLIDINSDQMAWMYRVNDKGVYIYSITEHSAADQAGLLPGDRIISVNGQAIETSSDLKTLLQNVSVGDELIFEIARSGQTQRITVTAGEYIPNSLKNAASNTSTSYQTPQNPQGSHSL